MRVFFLSLALVLVEIGLALCTSGHLQDCGELLLPEGSPTPLHPHCTSPISGILIITHSFWFTAENAPVET